jgi:hypothetical protein
MMRRSRNLRSRNLRSRNLRSRNLRSRNLREDGQAVVILVLVLTILIALFGAVMVDNVVQHDPLVKTTTIEHFTYRGLEAGLSDFMSEINQNPNQVTCNSTSPSGGQCPTEKDFLAWKRVPDTQGTGVTPEYYAWTDPKFCFTEACPVSKPTAHSTDTTTAKPTHTPPKPVLYVKETIYGAAGFPGDFAFEQSTLDLKPVNGFLTRIWWSTYEANDPALHGTTKTPPGCGYNYPTYNGPARTTPPQCSPVVFASGTQVYGPIYANDSIYITGKPTLGPVQTADPKCLFVYTSGRRCVTKASQETKTRSQRTITQTTTTFQASESGQSNHPLPTTDSTLEQYAAYDGCVYTGPTTIEFDGTDKMTVWSLGTDARAATHTTPACPSTHNKTGSTTNTGPVPNGTRGDGVIYVKTAPTPCAAGANPFDDYTKTKGTNGTAAQYTATTNAYDIFGAQPYPATNCEGDAFVSDNPTAGGVSGQLTIGTDNDIVITGTIEYQDCGTAFNSTHNHPCRFNATGSKTNDSLGLIAQNYVVVNHPVKKVCSLVTRTRKQVKTCTLTRASLATACKRTQLGKPAAALCNPIPDSSSSTITIDAALLALKHSFTVDNEGLIKGSGGVGSLDGTLKIYGSIDQKWRGVVGIVGTSGYVKDYDWNSIGAIVTPPHYLSPSTPSWTVGSSAVLNESTPPAFGAPTL